MKIISIVFDNCLANWILSCAQKNKVSISEFIRDLLYERMHQGPVILNHHKKFKQSNRSSQIQRSEMGYIIFTAKLLEKLVLVTKEQGEILCNLAFEETENLLNQMNFDNKKQRLCINLEEPLLIWLNSEAARLQVKVIPLIRKLIESISIQNNLITDGPELPYAQKIAIRSQITACKLLEKLVVQTIDGGAKILEEVRAKTDLLLAKLFSGYNEKVH